MGKSREIPHEVASPPSSPPSIKRARSSSEDLSPRRSLDRSSRKHRTSQRSHRSRRSRSASTRSRSRSRRSYSRHDSRSRRSYSRRHSRSHTHSPSHERRIRYYGTRENPFKSRVVGIFGLYSMTNEAKLMEVFEQFGSIERVSIIHDAKTGNSRGFGFIYFQETDQATRARTTCNGMTLDGKRIRVDYSITKRAHTPTPGVYMGVRKSSERGRRRRHRSKSRDRQRSKSRDCHRRRSRSKKRSRRRRDYSDHESSRYSRSRSR